MENMHYDTDVRVLRVDSIFHRSHVRFLYMFFFPLSAWVERLVMVMINFSLTSD